MSKKCLDMSSSFTENSFPVKNKILLILVKKSWKAEVNIEKLEKLKKMEQWKQNIQMRIILKK